MVCGSSVEQDERERLGRLVGASNLEADGVGPSPVSVEPVAHRLGTSSSKVAIPSDVLADDLPGDELTTGRHVLDVLAGGDGRRGYRRGQVMPSKPVVVPNVRVLPEIPGGNATSTPGV
jgi:hypothetical protein